MKRQRGGKERNGKRGARNDFLRFFFFHDNDNDYDHMTRVDTAKYAVLNALNELRLVDLTLPFFRGIHKLLFLLPSFPFWNEKEPGAAACLEPYVLRINSKGAASAVHLSPLLPLSLSPLLFFSVLVGGLGREEGRKEGRKEGRWGRGAEGSSETEYHEIDFFQSCT